MTTIGTPLSSTAKKVLFCGSGELGKEVVIELQRFGVEVIAVDRYEHAPAMQVAHRSHVIDMLNANALRAVIELEQPDFIVPEIEAIATSELVALEKADDIESAWFYSQEGGRSGAGTVIIEGFVDFDYEITLLTVRHGEQNSRQTTFCEPIGHVQKNGDYQQSWQPQAMSGQALKNAQEMAYKVTENLGGNGVFGVELFVKGDEVLFSEVSPRPHDTGLVTLISQDLSEFALHARAILGLPIPAIKQFGAAASSVILVEGESTQLRFSNLETALQKPNTQLRLFGKPEVKGQRRMGVGLALGETIEEAIEQAKFVSSTVKVSL